MTQEEKDNLISEKMSQIASEKEGSESKLISKKSLLDMIGTNLITLSIRNDNYTVTLNLEENKSLYQEEMENIIVSISNILQIEHELISSKENKELISLLEKDLNNLNNIIIK